MAPGLDRPRSWRLRRGAVRTRSGAGPRLALRHAALWRSRAGRADRPVSRPHATGGREAHGACATGRRRRVVPDRKSADRPVWILEPGAHPFEPSAGYALRSVERNAARRRSFVRPAARMIQPEMVAGSQPRSAATLPARRCFRSIVPRVSPTSTSSVLSSITSKARRPGCHASRSMTPRSPQIENDTSGMTCQSGESRRRACTTASASWACRLLSMRSRSPPRHLVMRSTRISSAPQTFRRVPSWIECEVTVFDPADLGPRHVRHRREVVLSPPTSDPHCSHRDPEPQVIHRRTPYRMALTCHVSRVGRAGPRAVATAKTQSPGALGDLGWVDDRAAARFCKSSRSALHRFRSHDIDCAGNGRDLAQRSGGHRFGGLPGIWACDRRRDARGRSRPPKPLARSLPGRWITPGQPHPDPWTTRPGSVDETPLSVEIGPPSVDRPKHHM